MKRRHGRTTLDVAAAIGREVRFVEQLLRDEEARGTIERLDDGRWALTAAVRLPSREQVES